MPECPLNVLKTLPLILFGNPLHLTGLLPKIFDTVFRL